MYGTWYDAATFACALRAPSRVSKVAASYLVPYVAFAAASFGQTAPADDPAPALAIRCAKALTCAQDGDQVIDRALVIVRDGHIESIAPERELAPPLDCELLDLGDLWITPGLIDLHSHVAGSMDINDGVYQSNPELRASASVVPDNARLQRALAAGVTTILFIPGSATTMGGQGILLRTSGERYADMVVRDPGSLKVAQADNPRAWGYGMGRMFLNWHIRHVLASGLAHARARARDSAHGESARGGDSARDRRLDLQYEVFPALLERRAQASVHTQVYQVVYSTLRILSGELGIDTYIDHGEFDAFELGALAESMGVAAILGPRTISVQTKARGVDHDGAIVGLAEGWQRHGHRHVGFNTDAPVVPAEELPYQATLGAHYGMDDARLETVRGLTIVPALAAGIAERVGSLEPGKDADLVAFTGDPCDPRSSVELVLVRGRLVYDARDAAEGERTY